MSGMCTTHTDGLMQVTKADCCCTMGAAWGPMCEHCPRKSTEEYEELCLEVGYSVDGHGMKDALEIISIAILLIFFL